MGHYFREAKTKADLSPEQLERYNALRSPKPKIPDVLLSRLHAIQERIGPVTSGEIWVAYEELVQDAIVLWILSGENPALEWVDLKVHKEEISEEEAKRRRDDWARTQEEWRERDEREEREAREWAKKNVPLEYYALRLHEIFDGFFGFFRKRNHR